MRYNDDVINAESWNTDLKKTVIHTNPDADEIPEHENKTIPSAAISSVKADDQAINHTPEAEPLKTGHSEKNEAESITAEQPADTNLHASNPDIIHMVKMAVSPVSTYESRSSTKRRKKRGLFLLSGLITGLVAGSKNHK